MLDSTKADPARDCLERGLDMSPLFGLSRTNFDKLVDRAIALIDGGQTESGEELLRGLSAVAPERAVLPFLLGASLMKRGAHQEALAAYDQALERADDRELGQRIRSARGQVRLLLNQLEEGLRDLAEAAEGPSEQVRQQVCGLLEAIVRDVKR